MWSQQRTPLQLQWREQRGQEESIQSLCERMAGPREHSQSSVRWQLQGHPASVLPAPCCVPTVVRGQGLPVWRPQLCRPPCTYLLTLLGTAAVGQALVSVCLHCYSFWFFSGAKCCMAYSGLRAGNTPVCLLPGQPTSLWFSI